MAPRRPAPIRLSGPPNNPQPSDKLVNPIIADSIAGWMADSPKSNPGTETPRSQDSARRPAPTRFATLTDAPASTDFSRPTAARADPADVPASAEFGRPPTVKTGIEGQVQNQVRMQLEYGALTKQVLSGQPVNDVLNSVKLVGDANHLHQMAALQGFVARFDAGDVKDEAQRLSTQVAVAASKGDERAIEHALSELDKLVGGSVGLTEIADGKTAQQVIKELGIQNPEARNNLKAFENYRKGPGELHRTQGNTHVANATQEPGVSESKVHHARKGAESLMQTGNPDHNRFINGLTPEQYQNPVTQMKIENLVMGGPATRAVIGGRSADEVIAEMGISEPANMEKLRQLDAAQANSARQNNWDPNEHGQSAGSDFWKQKPDPNEHLQPAGSDYWTSK